MTTPTILALLDTETTSTDHATGHVVEVALGLYDIEHGGLIRARSWLCTAPAEDVAASQYIHGVSPALVAARGVPFADVAKMVGAIVTKEAQAFAAHNADFDRAWFPLHVQNAAPWVDTCHDVEWPKRSTSRSLTAVALAHGVGVVRAHRALEDVLTLAALFDRAVELGADLPAMLARAMRPKVKVASLMPYEEGNATNRAHGFAWEPHPVKLWTRKIAREDIAGLPFQVREMP